MNSHEILVGGLSEIEFQKKSATERLGLLNPSLTVLVGIFRAFYLINAERHPCH